VHRPFAEDYVTPLHVAGAEGLSVASVEEVDRIAERQWNLHCITCQCLNGGLCLASPRFVNVVEVSLGRGTPFGAALRSRLGSQRVPGLRPTRGRGPSYVPTAEEGLATEKQGMVVGVSQMGIGVRTVYKVQRGTVHSRNQCVKFGEARAVRTT
jgi:hypothetical protein